MCRSVFASILVGALERWACLGLSSAIVCSEVADTKLLSQRLQHSFVGLICAVVGIVQTNKILVKIARQDHVQNAARDATNVLKTVWHTSRQQGENASSGLHFLLAECDLDFAFDYVDQFVLMSVDVNANALANLGDEFDGREHTVGVAAFDAVEDIAAWILEVGVRFWTREDWVLLEGCHVGSFPRVIFDLEHCLLCLRTGVCGHREQLVVALDICYSIIGIEYEQSYFVAYLY
jgi:hypothetical protein